MGEGRARRRGVQTISVGRSARPQHGQFPGRPGTASHARHEPVPAYTGRTRSGCSTWRGTCGSGCTIWYDASYYATSPEREPARALARSTAPGARRQLARRRRPDALVQPPSQGAARHVFVRDRVPRGLALEGKSAKRLDHVRSCMCTLCRNRVVSVGGACRRTGASPARDSVRVVVTPPVRARERSARSCVGDDRGRDAREHGARGAARQHRRDDRR